MANVIPSEGTQLEIESATPGTYTAISQQVSIGGPKPSVEKIDTTTLTSTRKTSRPSRIPDEGEVTFKIQYDPNDTTHQSLYTLQAAGTVKNWKLIWVDGMATPAHEIFPAYIVSIEGNDKEVDSNAEVNVTIAITATNVRTAGAGS